jgi:hypothetical protein
MEIAAELAAKPPVAMRLNKQRFAEVTQPASRTPSPAGTRIQKEAYGSGEPQKMMEAFFAKRSGQKQARAPAMDLLEHQGKALFRRYGIPVPSGRLWPEQPDWDGALVVKAQVPAGGRGKAGGIGFAPTGRRRPGLPGTMQGGSLNGRPVQAVYVEQRLDIHRSFTWPWPWTATGAP